jgi:transaldolase
MKFFLDTADIKSIEAWTATGLIDGITTNPTHLAKQGGDPIALLKAICAQVDGPVSIEVTEKEPHKVLAQARKIAAFADNVVVKIPFAKEYLSVIKTLVEEEVMLNITLIFSALQALCVAKLGVSYISPFLGRLDDIDVDGMQLLQDIVELKATHEDFVSDILAASIRNLTHLRQAALIGADIATFPASLLDQIMNNPLTAKGIAQFDADWKAAEFKEFFNV